jgi:hypothetical protein
MALRMSLASTGLWLLVLLQVAAMHGLAQRFGFVREVLGFSVLLWLAADWRKV